MNTMYYCVLCIRKDELAYVLFFYPIAFAHRMLSCFDFQSEIFVRFNSYRLRDVEVLCATAAVSSRRVAVASGVAIVATLDAQTPLDNGPPRGRTDRHADIRT